MKKIMFNDKYGLTEAVLEGRKTMTRRIAKLNEKPCPISGCLYCYHRDHDKGCEWILEHCKYKPGEVVAVAQSYKKLNEDGFVPPEWLDHTCESSAGYNNKMFVRADLMPERNLIRITNVRVERLQDISDEDCVKEGIWEARQVNYSSIDGIPFSPREAFAALIDKVSGKGTWLSNPWIFAYEFELVK